MRIKGIHPPLGTQGGARQGAGMGTGPGAAGGTPGRRWRAEDSGGSPAVGAVLPWVAAPRQFSRKRFQKKQQGGSNTPPPARYFRHSPASTPPPRLSRAYLSAFETTKGNGT